MAGCPSTDELIRVFADFQRQMTRMEDKNRQYGRKLGAEAKIHDAYDGTALYDLQLDEDGQSYWKKKPGVLRQKCTFNQYRSARTAKKDWKRNKSRIIESMHLHTIGGLARDIIMELGCGHLQTATYLKQLFKDLEVHNVVGTEQVQHLFHKIKFEDHGKTLVLRTDVVGVFETIEK